MRLDHFTVKNAPPIKSLAIEGLSEVVVFAGPNGVGKTTLLNSLLTAFRNSSPNPNLRIRIAATSEEEVKAWNGKRLLDTDDKQEAGVLRAFLQRSQKRGQLRSGVLNFDSSRAIQEIQPFGWGWHFADPFEEAVGWDFTYQPAKNRFQDVIHSLLRKIRSQKEEISAKALSLMKSGVTTMDLNFPDPLVKFKDAFSKLLPGKTLVDLNEQTQVIQYTAGGATLQLNALSSGEREVVTIVFDFLLRDPQHCVIVFDEPELHLHPELSYRLLRTLREVGEHNQFIFCTHSPDIITASIDQSVVFVAPSTDPERNQAITVAESDEVADVLHVLGQSIGVISLGKRIVLIEGDKSSLDKQVYGSIVGSQFPGLVLVPAGGKETIASFLRALESVLNQTVWGVDFFMLCDGDSAASTSNAADLERRSSGRLRFLSRYHLENYFLDEQLLAKVFRQVGTEEGSWLLEPERIKEFLRDAVKDFVPYATALSVAHRVRLGVGNVDIMPKNCTGADLASLVTLFEGAREKESNRIGPFLHAGELPKLVEEEYRKVVASVESGTDDWKRLVPGRPLLGKLAKQAKTDVGNMKRVFIRAATGAVPDPFEEIRSIFQQFAAYQGKR
jgi:energy-coupling factor transporter ATP-binding protein EcfA2